MPITKELVRLGFRLGLGLSLLSLTSCAIKTIVVDRHTLMEAEAAGPWPDVDNKILARAKKRGATAFAKEEIRGKVATPYQVLNAAPTPSSD